jgi:hypothetical protein
MGRKNRQMEPLTTEQVEALHQWVRDTFYGGLTPEESAIRQAAKIAQEAVRDVIADLLKKHNLTHLQDLLMGDE